MIVKSSLFVLSAALMMVLVLTACGKHIAATASSGEIEATEFMGQKLTPINEQLNNAIAGVQNIDRDSYRLTIDGAVENPLSLSYTDLLLWI